MLSCSVFVLCCCTVVVVLLLFFFFFKQKTAYEMRISDWSSDVCSSDLSGMPRCRAGGRYHVPPWVVPLILDKSGDALLPIGNGEYEGRAAFFDLSIDGRWGGVISGDRISIDFSPCPCGHKGPSIRDNIARYADLEGDDKIEIGRAHL